MKRLLALALAALLAGPMAHAEEYDPGQAMLDEIRGQQYYEPPDAQADFSPFSFAWKMIKRAVFTTAAVTCPLCADLWAIGNAPLFPNPKGHK